MKAPLLVELLTEELPPKSLSELASHFAAGVFEELVAAGLATRAGGYERDLATPRRLAVLVPDVSGAAPAVDKEVQGPATNAPEAAVAGFARKHGLSPGALERRKGPKGEVYVARVKAGGATLDDTLAGAVEKAVRKLPIPKVMRWGEGDAQFVRPVHGLVMLHGERVVPGRVLGLQSRGDTRGHRFLSEGPLKLRSAATYEAQLEDAGSVIVRLSARRAAIERSLQAEAARLGASLGAAEEVERLLDEVAALVEQPTVYVGRFDTQFLEVPQECLILTMRQNQKYFPLFEAGGKLMPKFLIVSNMRVTDPRHIIGGNERVVRPRLEDARFFYRQDRKRRLETRVPELAKVVYHNKLGTQLERVERIQLVAGALARRLGADAAAAERAAWLSKADLLTGMVTEFPELQGVMGRYYALHDAEPATVADAIEAHYRPRFAGDVLPEGLVACAVALADKLDTLVGLFGVGEQPTGEKDPFGLRRAALGVIRILVERTLALPLDELLAEARAAYPPARMAGSSEEVAEFIYARFSSYLKDRGFTTLQVDAVLALRPLRFDHVPRQLEAVRAFQSMPEADSLAAANKRVVNILRQAQSRGESFASPAPGELREPAERSLFEALQDTARRADTLYEEGDYTGYLQSFAVLKAPVDAFFDTVMVMAEEASLRRNRLGLLRELRTAMNRVADIARLAL